MSKLPDRGKTWFPLLLIVLSLLVLLLFPVLVGQRNRALRDEITRLALPADTHIGDLSLALLAETSAIQEFLFTGKQSSLERLRTARMDEHQALADLGLMLPDLGPPIARGWTKLQEDIRTWHAHADALLAGHGSEAARAERIGLLHAAHEDVSRSVDHLRKLVKQGALEREQEIHASERVEDGLTALLVFIALASTFVVAGLDRRLRLFARRSEQERREKTALLESTGEGTYGVDPEGRFTFINRAGAEMLGYAPEEIIGQRVHDLIHAQRADGSTYPADECPIMHTLHAGDGIRVDDEVLWRKDGSAFPTEYGTFPIIEDGEVRGAVVNFLDITSRKQAEHERALLLEREQVARSHAEKAEQRSKFLADASVLFSNSLDYETTLRSLAHLVVPRIADSCIIYLVDESGEVQRLEPTHRDPAMQEILREQLQQHPPRLESLIPPVRDALVLGQTSMIPEVSANSLKAVPGDSGHVSMLGDVSLQSLIVAPLQTRGRILGAISYGSSISGWSYNAEDILLAEELASRAALAIDNARLYRASQAAVAARDQILGFVSHDLRSPLNVVKMGTQALLRHWPPTKGGEAERRQLEAIARSTKRMSRLIQDLLDVVQIESGHLTIDAAPVDGAAVVGEALDMVRPSAEEKSVVLENKVPADLPPLLVDSERMVQVFSNLLANAIKFTPEGGQVSVEIRSVTDTEVCFAVSDTGCGISETDLPHLFDRFWQARENQRGGTGLGLAISKGIVEGHGGRIWVESQKGCGSCFLFTAPIANPPADPQPHGAAAALSSAVREDSRGHPVTLARSRAAT